MSNLEKMPMPIAADRVETTYFDRDTAETGVRVNGIQEIVYGSEFDEWLVQRAYSLIAPMCHLGLLVTLGVCLAWNPHIFRDKLWEQNTQYIYMILWQLASFLIFSSVALTIRFGAKHINQKFVVTSFLVLGQALFTWDGYIGWGLWRDTAVYVMSSMVVACVFTFPGRLRGFLYVGSACLLTTAIYMSGTAPGYFTDGNVLSPILVVIVCFCVDRFMMNLNRTLYGRQRMVEIERARADDILYNALPASIANELKKNNIVKAEKFDRMTVLFADIVGFTKFSSSVPPDALVHVLNQIFSEFDSLVDTYAVEKIKTIGDAYMVVGKDNATGVAHLALDLIKTIEAYNKRNGVDFSIRVGMHLGPTVAGVIGLKRFLYDVWGDAVNTASRMESSSLPGRIHVTPEVRAQLEGEFDFEDRGESDIKGKGLMRTYFLLERPAG